MQELCSELNNLLPGEGSSGQVQEDKVQEDLEVTVVGSERRVNITGSPIGAGMSTPEAKSEEKHSLQDELNALNPKHGKQHGHHGHGRGHQMRH